MKVSDIRLTVIGLAIRGEYTEVVLKTHDDRPHDHNENAKVILHLKNPGLLQLGQKFEIQNDYRDLARESQ